MGRRVVSSTTYVVLVAASLGCGSNTPEGPTFQYNPRKDIDGAADPPDGSLQKDVDGATDTPDGTLHKAYPDGPFGTTPGQVITNYEWMGWREPKTSNYKGALEHIRLGDYYDPTGTKGIKAIFINASAGWCSICKVEIEEIAEAKKTWGGKGVVFLQTLFENAAYQPIQQGDLAAWGERYQVDWTLLLDPTNKLGAMFDTQTTPMNAVIDPTSMKIVDVITGMPQDGWFDATFSALAAQ